MNGPTTDSERSRFSDFMKVGLIMNFIILFANIFITTIIFPF